MELQAEGRRNSVFRGYYMIRMVQVDPSTYQTLAGSEFHL